MAAVPALAGAFGQVRLFPLRLLWEPFGHVWNKMDQYRTILEREGGGALQNFKVKQASG